MAQQSNGSADNSLDGMLLLAMAIILPIILWHFKHELLTRLVFTWWYYLLSTFSWLSPAVESMRHQITQTDLAAVSFDQVEGVATWVGNYTRWVVSPVLAYLAYRVYTKSPHESNSKEYSMESLLRSEVRVWPQIAPVIGLDLINADIDNGPWAMAMTEYGFVKRHNLINADGRLDADRAETIMADQLGRMYRGVRNMPAHSRALFALFMLRLDGDIKGFKDLRSDLSMRASKAIKIKPSTSAVMSKVDGYVRKYENHAVAKELAKLHAYETTYLTSLFQRAKHGVFPPCEILWLKPVDRVLWYSLHQEGLGQNKVAWVEAAGVRAHWMAEIALGRALESPTVKPAVAGLIEELKHIKPS